MESKFISTLGFRSQSESFRNQSGTGAKKLFSFLIRCFRLSFSVPFSRLVLKVRALHFHLIWRRLQLPVMFSICVCLRSSQTDLGLSTHRPADMKPNGGETSKLHQLVSKNWTKNSLTSGLRNSKQQQGREFGFFAQEMDAIFISNQDPEDDRNWFTNPIPEPDSDQMQITPLCLVLSPPPPSRRFLRLLLHYYLFVSTPPTTAMTMKLSRKRQSNHFRSTNLISCGSVGI